MRRNPLPSTARETVKPGFAPEASRPRLKRGRLLCAIAMLAMSVAVSAAQPFVPSSDSQWLADLPPGARHAPAAGRDLARSRLDVALPLAQFYVRESRATGDLRYLGYAEGVLAHWREQQPVDAAVLVLEATILQSRHAFSESLALLDQALTSRPTDAQAWLTRASVLRVLGRYEEARASCARVANADAAVATLCTDGVRALTGQLQPAFQSLLALPGDSLSGDARAWRASQLGEMAVSLGDAPAAERWFREALRISPDDLYSRAAYADLLLASHRPREVLALLHGYESMEPMLLRLAIAQRELNDPSLDSSKALLGNAFSVEEQRGDSVHRREQARFMLEVLGRPDDALKAALANWAMQREPADALILLQAAQAARQPMAAAPARDFVMTHALQDVRLHPYFGGSAS
jgi:tetratricopeptide (TPR) repeat protein